MPFYLPRSAAAWGSDDFKETFQQELAQQGVEVLPLQQGLSSSAYALEEGISAMFLGAEQQERIVKIRVGVFFQGQTPGCACADDPTPEDTYNEYCELEVELDLGSTGAVLKILDWGRTA